jgi:hypothetical protein
MMLDIAEAKSILDDVLEDLPDATWKAAYGFPCIFAGGRVFGLYDGDFIVLRFRPDQVEELVGRGEGSTLKGAKIGPSARMAWFRVAHDQLPGPERLRELILLSYETRLNDSGG